MNRLITLGGCILLSLAVMAGCGIKGPPLAPLKAGNTLAAPDNLAYTLNGDIVSLSWTHTVDPDTAKVSPEGFKVFVAVKSPDGCEGCPFIFKEAGVVPMPAMQFQYTLKTGVLHYFRVQAVGDDDKVSSFSKTLYIDPETDQ
jgi:predicted small lipoprotein YifL